MKKNLTQKEIKAFMDKITCDKLSDIISHNNAENKALNSPMYWWAGSVSWRKAKKDNGGCS